MTAGFILEEARDVASDCDHVSVFIKHRWARRAKTHDITKSTNVKIHPAVILIGAQHAHRHAACNGALEALAVTHTKTVRFNKRSQRDAKISFIHARSRHMTTHTHELRSVARRATNGALATERLPPRNPVLNDRADRCERFHIVHNGRSTKQAFYRRKWRLQTRPTTATFDRFKQSRLFAADVGASTAMQIAVHRKRTLAAQQPLLTEDALRIRLLNCALNDLRLMVILTTDEEVRSVELARVACNRNAFENKMWIVITKQTIFESAWLGFIAIDAEVATTAIRWGKKCPLESARKSCAAAAAEIRVLHHRHDFRGRHAERLLKRLIAACRDVLINTDGLAILRVAPRKCGDALGENWFGHWHGLLSLVSVFVSARRTSSIVVRVSM